MVVPTARALIGRRLGRIYRIGRGVACAGMGAVALLAVVLRLLLPTIGEHRAEIEAAVSASLEHPITIGRIEASWRAWTPCLLVTDISVVDPLTSRPAIRFQAMIELDLLASLRQLRIQSSLLSISGVQLTVLRAPDGTIRVEGIDLRSHLVAIWLLQQPAVLIRAERIVWHDRKAQRPPLNLSELTLQLHNLGDSHQLHGTAKLPSELGERFGFGLDAQGDLLAGDWSGKLYIEGRGIHAAALEPLGGKLGTHSVQGQLGFRAWSEWREGRLTEVEGDFDARSLGLARAAPRGIIGSAGARFLAWLEGRGGWRLDLNRLMVTTPTGPWPEARMAVKLRTGPGEPESILAYASFLRIDDLVPLLREVLPRGLASTLEEAQATGELREARLGYYPARTDAERLYVRADFSGVGSRPVGRLPGFVGLAGVFEADARSGRVRLSSPSTELSFQDSEMASIGIDTLAGEINWQRRDEGWILSTELVEATNQDLAARLTGSIAWTPATFPTVDLEIRLARGQLARLADYIPAQLAPKARAWLSRAILGGSAPSGTILLRGPLDTGFFDSGRGTLAAEFSIQGGILEYASDWPRIEGIEAQIRIRGRSLTLRAPVARTLGASLREVTVLIPKLGGSPLRVQIRGRATGPAAEGLRFVMASPLRESLGKGIERLAIDGGIGLDLDLDFTARGNQTVAGTLSFPGNMLRIGELAFTDLRGSLNFGTDGWSSRALRAQLFRRPVRLEVKGDSESGWATISGKADRRFIIERLSAMGSIAAWIGAARLRQAIHGETSWEAKVDLARPWRDPTVADKVSIRSPLVGLAIDAPAPIGKTAQERLGLEIKTSLSGGDLRLLEIGYGDRVHAQFRLATAAEGSAVKDLQLVLGGAAVYSPAQAPGFWIGGRLKEFSLSAWSDFLGMDWDPSTRPGNIWSRLRVDVSVAEAEALGYRFKDLRLEAGNQAGQWLLKFDGPDAKGWVSAPYELATEPIEAVLDRLALDRPVPGPTRGSIDPRQLPALSVDCSELRVEAIDFGHMRLRTRPAADGLSLEALSFTSPTFDIDAKGIWRLEGGSHSSRFDIDAKSPELGKLLGSFGYGGANLSGGKTALAMQVAWPGTPASFSLPALSGKFKIDVRDGRLLDVGTGAGRIFGLLSINTIWRRLSLNFTDLFGKGFTFDRIAGDFDLEQGNAYTSNLSVLGPSARIDITGRIGLATQDYDQRVTVAPALSSNLPIAGAFFGPLGIGAGAAMFLAGKVFPALPDGIDSMLARRYSITGGWDNPVVSPRRDSGAGNK